MKADDVVRQQPRVDLLADAVGQHPPGVGLGPRDVDEVVQEDVRAGAADEVRERVQVVVVDHHHRFAGVLDLLDHRPGQVFVDDVVAELEGLDLLAADVRGVGQVPQVVLDEPQHRVREHVVEAVVGLRVADHQADLVLTPGGGAHGDRAAVVAERDGGVELVHRRGDPDRVAVRGQPRERGHQAAGAPHGVAVRVEGHGAAVAHQHQRSPLCRPFAHDPSSSVKMRR